MRKLPIPFSDSMVAAILAGRKVQTRRVISRARVFGTPERPSFTLAGQDLARAMQNADRFRHMGDDSWFWESDAFEWQAPHTRTGWLAHIGYAPGDLLWVRETYYQFGHWEPVPGVLTKGGKQKWAFVPESEKILFSLPEGCPLGRHSKDPAASAWHKRLGRFMPRSASRITLRVTGVKVERLMRISEADAIAEGMFPRVITGPYEGRAWHWLPGIDEASCYSTPGGAFAALWKSINGPTSWIANPWVMAIAFEPIFENIDKVKA